MKESFKDLQVWQSGMRLAVLVCTIVRRFDHADRIDFGSQLIRSSVSVPSNVAEGAARFGARDQKRFYLYAKGSLNELETQLEIVAAIGLIPQNRLTNIKVLLEATRKCLTGLIQSLERKLRQVRKPRRARTEN